MPDPIFNTIGATHGYPSLTAGNWHMQNTMDVGDVDNDGIADVAIIGYQSRGVAVALGGVNGDLSSSVLFDVGSATGSFTVASSPGSYLPLYGYVADVDIADLNADGYGDLLLSTQTQSGTVSHWGGVYYTCLSTGTAGTCTLQGWGLEGYQITSVVAKDVNSDGLPDVFTGYRANSTGISSMMYRTIGRSMNLSK